MSAHAEPRAAGGCLCGGVRYEVTGPLRDILYCHCTECRRWTGHFMAATAAGREHLVLREASTLEWYRSSPAARRGFCRRCGASLFWDRDGRDIISIAAGTLDAPTRLHVGQHMFCAEKGDYYAITGAAPQSPGGTVTAPLWREKQA